MINHNNDYDCDFIFLPEFRFPEQLICFFFLLWMEAIHNIIPQTSGTYHINVVTETDCPKPCIPIEQCPELIDLIKTNVRVVQEATCSFEGRNPQVSSVVTFGTANESVAGSSRLYIVRILVV